MAGHRTTTFAGGSHVPAASLNAQQDRAHTLDRATSSAAGAPTDTLGADWITYQSPDAGIGTGTVVTLDASDRDWRERLVQVTARFVGTAARRWGRADEHVGNDPATVNVRTALGVTGPGAVGAASAPVANGTPPVVTTDSCPIPLDVRLDGTIWLFADPSTGALKLYNNTTTPLHVDLLVMATGRSTDPAAPPPDLVPTLTEILWLTPTVAASRPSNPGAVIALHRATDTGAVTLWDGAAWRSLGIASPLTTRGDLWRRDASGDARLAIGGDGKFVRSNGTDPSWQSIVATDVSDSTAVGRASLTAVDEAAARAAIDAAPTSHTHAAGDITSGTLAVARGGTGGGTASAARTALGIQDSPRLIPLFGYATASSASPTVQALAGFTPADYAISGRTTTLTLDAIGSVTSVAQTGTLEVLNAAGTVVATLTWTETTPTRKTASITLPGSAEIYRARVSCSGVTNPLTDFALIGGAVLRITWS
jgi:hypothetical protein